MSEHRMARSWRDVSINVGEATLQAQSLGPGGHPALLLIGAATWSRDWWPDELCAQLVADGFRVLRFDQRDTGGSTSYPPGEPGYTAEDLLADTVAVLDAFDVDRAYVLGLSMGGGTAQLLAVRHPERVAGLGLVSTTAAGDLARDLPPPTPEILATFEDAAPEPDWADRAAVVDWVVEGERPYAGPSSFDEPAMRELVGRVWDRTPSMAAAATNHGIVASAAEPVDLTTLRDRPAVVLHGSVDPLFPPEHGRALAEAIGAPLVILESVGHQTPPPHTWPIVREALRALTTDRPGGQ